MIAQGLLPGQTLTFSIRGDGIEMGRSALGLPVVPIIKRFYEVKRLNAMNHAQREAVKLEKFRKLVRHARQNAPYYADIIDRHKIDVDRCVPGDFPVLTKSDLMEHFDRIITDRRITKKNVEDFLSHSIDPNHLLLDSYHVVHTSGSSGEIGYFLFSEKEWVAGLFPRGRSRRKTIRPQKFGRVRMVYYGAVCGHFAGVSLMCIMQQGFLKRLANLLLLEINIPLPQTIETLNDYQPDVLSGYTTGLKLLAEQQKKGTLHISPQQIISGGEAMTHEDKTMIKQAFDCDVVNYYGTSEHLIMGLEKEEDGIMTLFDNDLIYELADDHTLVTNLFNHTQPLIRYKMSDVLRPLKDSHDTSPYLRINGLVGRTETIPVFVNRDGVEDYIHPISIVELFIPGITRFQMRLVSKTAFDFAVVLDSLLNAQQKADALNAAESQLRHLLKQKNMDAVTFNVLPVDDIPVDLSSGKFRLIVEPPVE